MSIFVVGINHKTAPVNIREQIYFAVEKLPLYLQDLVSRGFAHEAVLLSTCNRSELYCDADDISVIRDWFCNQSTADRATLEAALYLYRDEEAVAHIMEVACGLDSMVVGEPEILGQLKTAYSESCTIGTVGSLFHRLFQEVFSVAKEIRTSTAVGACPVSVASAAVHFVKQRMADFSNANVVLIGAGDTGALLIRYLNAYLSKPVILVNRSIDKATVLAESAGGYVFSLDKLTTALARADIVFSATGSATPVVNKAMMAEAMQARADKPILLVDIAVPRDIDAAVAEIPNVNLYGIDDLKAIIEQNRQGREHAADKSREMIVKKTAAFIAGLHSHDKVTHTIRAYRGQIEDISQSELLKAKQQLTQGEDPIEVLENFARTFTQKLLHEPSVQLRQAGAEGRFELLKFAKQLFAIPDAEAEGL